MGNRLLTVLLFLGIVTALPAEVNVPFGRGDGQISFLNENSVKQPFGGPLPLGPLSFRVHQGQTWILDSVAGKLCCFSATGELKSALQIASSVQPEWLGDLAFAGKDADSSVWVTNRHSQEILLVSAKGQILKKIGGLGDKQGQFLDLTRIETGASGRLYAWDAGRQMVSIFDGKGTWLRDVPGATAGFSLDEQETLSIGIWTDKDQKLSLRIETIDGKSRILPTDVVSETAPQVWMNVATKEWLVAVIDGEKEATTWKLTRVSEKGKTVAVLDVKVPQNMIRSLTQDEQGKIWVAIGDYGTAPKGTLEIKSFDLGGTPEG